MIAAAHGAQVIAADPGRGRQLNAGASAASGDTLLFLHADTLLPSDAAAHVDAALSTSGAIAGAFRLKIDAPSASFRLIERAVNWRSLHLQLPYGDQAIFMRAATFREAGGFPDVPVMEDFALMRRFKRSGKIALADAAVLTSARRWLARGIWRTTLLNQACIAAFLCGISPHRIALWRNRVGTGARRRPVLATPPAAQ